MVSTFTTNTHLELQGTGDNAGTWGNELNIGDFTAIDSVFGAVTSITLSSVDVTLSTSQTQANLIVLNGALTANVNLIFPAIGRTFVVKDATTGAFTVTLKIGAGANAATIKGGTQTYVLDSANVYQIGVATTDQRLVPTGARMGYCGATAPSGWLLCFGQAISRTSFAALFDAIGTAYGAGDGSTTFNVPDYRGRVAAGADNMGGVAAGRLTNSATGGVNGTALGNAGGEQAHTNTVAETAPHTHDSVFGVTHNGTGIADQKLNGAGGSVTVTSQSTGGGAAHNNVQPTLIENVIIKT